MSFKFEKGTQVLRDVAAEFVSRESNRTSLITVTSVSLSTDFSKVIFLISVYPEEAEKEALDFLKRKRGELRTYLGAKVKTKRIPFVDFEIDKGEKTRQRLDEIL
ncbi:MAG: ribosome-binding factor A [Candidatus Pacebacteria bacterium]|nr:ribosome-binding factor A [Candidatus Paceibacterota bacterium]